MLSPLVQAAADAGVTTLRLSTPALKPYGTVIMESEAVDNATHGAIDGAKKLYWAEPLTRMVVPRRAAAWSPNAPFSSACSNQKKKV